MSASTEADPLLVVVGRIGRAFGLRGEVVVEVRTDSPEERFAPGAVLSRAEDGGGDLVVAAARWHSGRLLVGFEGVGDRTAAEGLRGVLLSAVIDADDEPEDPEEFYDRQLEGLRALGPDGELLGVVSEVVHLPGHDLLAVAVPAPAEGAAEVLVPFVAQIVVEVDLAGGLVRLDPPGGLFSEPEPASPESA